LLRERAADCVDCEVACLASSIDAIPELSTLLLDSPFFGPPGLEPTPLQLSEELDGNSMRGNDIGYIPTLRIILGVSVAIDALPWKEMSLSQHCTIELWLSLIEGMTAVLVTCPRSLQSKLLHTLGEITNSFMKNPPGFVISYCICVIGDNFVAGIEFAAYCLSHLILPMLQKWLRREGQTGSWRENSASVRNFKQAVGLFTDLAVGYVQQANSKEHIQFLN
jgi:hypothetical protein